MKKVYRTSVYDSNTGKRKSLRADSPEELQRKVLEVKQQILRGEELFTKANFSDWADKWYTDQKLPLGLSPKTLGCIKRSISHLKKRFGRKKIQDIKLADFQVFVNELAVRNPNTGKPSSRKLIRDLIQAMNGILRYAAANGIPGVINFCDAVIIPRQATVGGRRALTESEQRMVLETEHQVKLPAMIMMFSGLRLGEALALQWDDVDFDSAIISVDKSMVFNDNIGIITKGGKTKNATRVVAIPPILVDYLREEKAKSKTELICVKTDGKPHTSTSWKKAWDSYILELNLKYGYDNKFNKHNPFIQASELPLKIERFTAHYLRHTYATILYLQGVDAVTAKQMMGHADITTTINIYTDLQNFNRKSLSDEYKEKLKNEYKIDYSL